MRLAHPETFTWTPLQSTGDVPSARYGLTLCTTNSGELVLVGGQSEFSHFNEVYSAKLQ
jgi:hypothetical protein